MDGKDNIIDLPVVTTLDLDPDRVLRQALKADLQTVIIIGRCQDGSEYFASSVADGGSVLWDLERTKLRLLRTADDA